MRLRHLLWLLLPLAPACCPAVDPPGFCWYDSDCGSGSQCEGGSSWCGGTCVRHAPRSCVGLCGNGQFCDTQDNVCRFIWKATFIAPANGAHVPVNSVVEVRASAAQDPGSSGGLPPPPSVRLGVGEAGAPPTFQDLLPPDAGDAQYAGTINVIAPVVYDLTVAVPGAGSQDFLTITADP